MIVENYSFLHYVNTAHNLHETIKQIKPMTKKKNG